MTQTQFAVCVCVFACQKLNLNIIVGCDCYCDNHSYIFALPPSNQKHKVTREPTNRVGSFKSDGKQKGVRVCACVSAYVCVCVCASWSALCGFCFSCFRVAGWKLRLALGGGATQLTCGWLMGELDSRLRRFLWNLLLESVFFSLLSISLS